MLNIDTSNLKRVLCLGAHCDDIEIGAGATILRLLRQRPDLEVTWVVFSGNEVRRAEAKHAAESFLVECRTKSIQLHAFKDELRKLLTVGG